MIIRSGKSEAAITNNKRLRFKYCTVEANYTGSIWSSRYCCYGNYAAGSKPI